MQKRNKLFLILVILLAVLLSLFLIPKSSWKKILPFKIFATVYQTSETLYNTAVSNNWTATGNAWGENIGWLTFSPSASNTVYVADDSLSGYLYGENVGWISLSCRNTDTCGGDYPYGVSNDGEGNLSGFAWGENTGWIDFGSSSAPYNHQVIISATGTFSGYAYGENVGWINFGIGESSATTTWTQVSSRTQTHPTRRRTINSQPSTDNAGGNNQNGTTLPEVIATTTSTTTIPVVSTSTPTTTPSVETPKTLPTQKPTTLPTKEVFTRNLQLGSVGDDVKLLQIYLNNHGFTISTTGTGSKGHESTSFGQKTKSAVAKYQEYYKDEILTPFGLTVGTGYFGTATRNFINNNY